MAGIGDLQSAVNETTTARRRGFGFYVYLLKYENGIPFYVGKGKGPRIRQHITNARYKKNMLSRIINKIGHAGQSIVYAVDSVHASESGALSREAELIAQYGRRDLSQGPLANHTNGGEGVCGLRFSEETRARMSEWRKAYAQSEHGARMIRETADRNRGKRHSEEHKAKIVAKLTGRPCSEATRAKIGRANSGVVLSPERRAEISESLRGKTHSRETRLKMSRSHGVTITINGVTKTQLEWAEESGQSSALIGKRISRGWEPLAAVRTPKQQKVRC